MSRHAVVSVEIEGPTSTGSRAAIVTQPTGSEGQRYCGFCWAASAATS